MTDPLVGSGALLGRFDFLPLILLGIIEVKFVQYAVKERRQHEADGRKKNDTAKHRICGGEKLGGSGGHGRNGPHASEDHRSVQNRVDPGKLGNSVVAEYADAERDAQDNERQQ